MNWASAIDAKSAYTGGHCERGDLSLRAAALREATEESGITGLRLLPSPVRLDRHAVRCHPGGSYHLDVQYVAIAPPGARYEVSAESDALRWFPVDALPGDSDDALRRLVASAVLPPREHAHGRSEAPGTVEMWARSRA